MVHKLKMAEPPQLDNRKGRRFADLPTVRRKSRKIGFGKTLYAEIERRFHKEDIYEFRVKDFKDLAEKYSVGTGTVGYYMRSMENERDLERIARGVYVLCEEDPHDPYQG